MYLMIIFFLFAFQTRLLLPTTGCWKTDLYILIVWGKIYFGHSFLASHPRLPQACTSRCKNISSCMSESWAENQQTNLFFGRLIFSRVYLMHHLERVTPRLYRLDMEKNQDTSKYLNILFFILTNILA